MYSFFSCCETSHVGAVCYACWVERDNVTTCRVLSSVHLSTRSLNSLPKPWIRIPSLSQQWLTPAFVLSSIGHGLSGLHRRVHLPPQLLSKVGDKNKGRRSKGMGHQSWKIGRLRGPQVFGTIFGMNHLVGGFKLGFYFPLHIWDVILPIDKLIFFKMVKTTNQIHFLGVTNFDPCPHRSFLGCSSEKFDRCFCEGENTPGNPTFGLDLITVYIIWVNYNELTTSEPWKS